MMTVLACPWLTYRAKVTVWDDVLQLLVVARFWSPHSTRTKILAWLHLSLHTRTRAAELFSNWPAQHWSPSHNFIIAEYKMPRDLGDTAAPRHRSHNHEFLRPHKPSINPR
jgi:hypothetical protein